MAMQQHTQQHDRSAALQHLLDHTVAANPSIRNAVLRVDVPGAGLSWKGASGLAVPDRQISMQPDDQFRSASVGKLICATTTLLLVEQGLIELDSSIAQYLPNDLIHGLHVVNGHDYGSAITVRQLLNHTSGLPQYFRDPEFLDLLFSQPDRTWQPTEVITYVKQHMQPQFAPGHGWHYNDTGYLLLGLIIEAVTGQPLHHVYRTRLFEPLGMDQTYMLFHDQPRPNSAGREPAHVFVGDLDYSGARSLSADWAGGGLITTVDDLSRLIRALADQRIFEQRTTYQAMTEWTPTPGSGAFYGLGIWRFVPGALNEPIAGELWGHHGSSRSFMYHWTARNATICGTLNQDQAPGVWHDQLPVAQLMRDCLILLNATEVS